MLTQNREQNEKLRLGGILSKESKVDRLGEKLAPPNEKPSKKPKPTFWFNLLNFFPLHRQYKFNHKVLILILLEKITTLLFL